MLSKNVFKSNINIYTVYMCVIFSEYKVVLLK